MLNIGERQKWNLRLNHLTLGIHDSYNNCFSSRTTCDNFYESSLCEENRKENQSTRKKAELLIEIIIIIVVGILAMSIFTRFWDLKEEIEDKEELDKLDPPYTSSMEEFLKYFNGHPIPRARLHMAKKYDMDMKKLEKRIKSLEKKMREYD